MSKDEVEALSSTKVREAVRRGGGMEGCREDGYAAGWRMFEGRELVSRYECLTQEGKGDRKHVPQGQYKYRL